MQVSSLTGSVLSRCLHTWQWTIYFVIWSNFQFCHSFGQGVSLACLEQRQENDAVSTWLQENGELMWIITIILWWFMMMSLSAGNTVGDLIYHYCNTPGVLLEAIQNESLCLGDDSSGTWLGGSETGWDLASSLQKYEKSCQISALYPKIATIVWTWNV